MNTTDNLTAIGTAADASEAVPASLEEAKLKLQEAQAVVTAAVEEAKTALLAVTGAIETAQSATGGALSATEEHLAESQRLEHDTAVYHLTEAQTNLGEAYRRQGETREGVQGQIGVLTEIAENTAKALAAVGTGLEDRQADAAGAREGIEHARTQVASVRSA